jgi:hypothetical protein
MNMRWLYAYAKLGFVTIIRVLDITTKNNNSIIYVLHMLAFRILH